MKSKIDAQKTSLTLRRALFGALALLFMLTGVKAFAGQGENVSTNACLDDEVVTALDSFNSDKTVNIDWQRLVRNAFAHRQKIIQELLNIFNNPQSDLYAKCVAANYLGEMRASEAADSLAPRITIRGPFENEGFHFAPGGGSLSIMQALIKIGTPSIPAVMRNLAESDDEQGRMRSVAVLSEIEGDKDVVQLQLQKAIDAQSDATKKARLQSALKMLWQPIPISL